MFTLKTGLAGQQLNPDGVTVLAVPFEILDETGTVVQAMTESFPLTTTTDEVRAALERHLEVFTEDHARHEEVKEHQDALDASAVVAEEITNITI